MKDLDEFGGSVASLIAANVGAFVMVVVSTLVWIILQPFCLTCWLFKRLKKWQNSYQYSLQ